MARPNSLKRPAAILADLPLFCRCYRGNGKLATRTPSGKPNGSTPSAPPLTRDPALVEPYALLVQALVRQIADLNASIAQFEEQLGHAVAQHPDDSLFRSVPGAGDALVPRLIAGFGSDRERYQSADAVATCIGIAPIIRQSGKTRLVTRRLACPKFLRQTFHELADQTRKWSSWSKAYYTMKHAAGMAHHVTPPPINALRLRAARNP
jgi:transposase